MKCEICSIVVALVFILQTLSAQSQRYRGYPQKNADIRSEFVNPPKGYGNVPFYWWTGDSLNPERMKEQLDILSESATDGFAVSYIHLDPKVDLEEMKGGYGLFGKTEAGRPRIFSEDWWKIWSWFGEECAAKDIGLGLDDYTVGWIGNGFYADEILQKPSFRDYRGELQIESVSVRGGTTFTAQIPDTFLTAVAWPGKVDLTPYIQQGKLTWKVPGDKRDSCRVYLITTKRNHLLHPDIGKEYVRHYFDRFEQRMGKAADRGMNYFFQDELSYPIHMGSWATDFPAEFEKRKGYDIMPYLPALKENIGSITPKIRLDYCEVLMDLAEDRYFKPIYEWHASRGLIYGSDNLKRGRDPLAYLDYFRANSWYTAPGNDAPSKGSSFLQTKVSSSITHLYERKRTWLEAFHSMGWGSTGAWLTQQLDHHFMAGGNLLCLHGLYYSTHGGWWEWAPPCFHFRMPYWPHMKKWLQYAERLSYLMSQGSHVCDIALMYPTESMQAYPSATTKIAFDQAMKLSNAGLDYDFVDYGSLRKSTIDQKHLRIADEKYRILILADMQAVHQSTLQKAYDFYQAGGIVIASGQLPKATTRMGENDPEMDRMVRELFGFTASEAVKIKEVKRQENAAGGIGLYIPGGEMVDQIQTLLTPDFLPTSGVGKVIHRRVGEHDIYMVMDVPKGSECFFRTKGKVELWNASDGSIVDYPILRQDEEGTWLRLEKEASNSYLFVFSAGEPLIASQKKEEERMIYSSYVKGFWETELLPTLDNKWGDFRFPASDLIGAEARSFKHQPADLAPVNWTSLDFMDQEWPESVYGYGFQFWLQQRKHNWMVSNENNRLEYSWQYGVFDNPGSQGWHGLKGKVSDGFFILDQGTTQIYETHVYAPVDGDYRIEMDGVLPDSLFVDQRQVEKQLFLHKGWHPVRIVYAHTQKTQFKLQKGSFRDFRKRGAVVFFPASSPVPVKPLPYDRVISTRWALGDHLLYDPYGGAHPIWNYRFYSVPGMEQFEMTVAGSELNVWCNGKKLSSKNIELLNRTDQGISTYRVRFPKREEKVALIAFSLKREPGYQGAAAICKPIMIQTGKGLLEEGDWSKSGALKYYSGGMYYRKDISLPALNSGNKVILDLGDVNATCELKVNGKEVGFLMRAPYKLDITSYVNSGENLLEVLVYSTLSNHYQDIPTPYRGEGVAGLLGPVSVRIFE